MEEEIVEGRRAEEAETGKAAQEGQKVETKKQKTKPASETFITISTCYFIQY